MIGVINMAPIPTDCTSTSHVLHGQYGVKEGRQRDEDKACLHFGNMGSGLAWKKFSINKSFGFLNKMRQIMVVKSMIQREQSSSVCIWRESCAYQLLESWKINDSAAFALTSRADGFHDDSYDSRRHDAERHILHGQCYYEMEQRSHCAHLLQKGFCLR